MNPSEQFKEEKVKNIQNQAADPNSWRTAHEFMVTVNAHQYSYNFTWMGRPIIQYPQDMIAMQELIWEIKPDLIIETGIAHGGSLIYYASILELIGKGEVLGIDIDIREHNRQAIEEHPMFKRIKMLQGSSTDPKILEQVKEFARGNQTILVTLDSNHTHDHVLQELNLYSPFVTTGSYLVVFDTIIEHFPEGSSQNRPWDKGNNAKTAVWEFLKGNDSFEIDKNIDNKILISVAPDGYLKKIK
jgi:cephalosporin hydroxylase